MNRFSPEQINVFNQETGQRQYGDPCYITRAQLVTTLDALEGIQPEIAFTRDDLVGYHRLQYGMHEFYIEDTIDLGFDSSESRNGEYAERFYQTLPEVIGQRTIPAVMQRIIIGGADRPSAQELDISEVEDFLELRTVRDQKSYEVLALYPAEGYSLKYRGRQTRQLGTLALGMSLAEVKVSTALIDVNDEKNHIQHQLLVATQEGHNRFETVVEAISRV